MITGMFWFFVRGRGKLKCYLKNSKILLKKYYNIENAQYVCESWLLSKEIADMLDEKSNIIKFQNLFDIKPSKNGGIIYEEYGKLKNEQ